jgi:hypothetical protein
MRARWGYEWGQSLQKFMPLHHDVSRSVSPAGLEPVRESPVGHFLETIGCQRRPGHITTQTFESIPIVSGNSHIGV